MYAGGQNQKCSLSIRSVLSFLIYPANGNFFRACARIFAVRQGRIGRRVLVAVRKVKPDAALRQKDRVGSENVSVRGFNTGRCGFRQEGRSQIS